MKKKKYKKKFSKDDSPGWQSIEDTLKKTYDTVSPRHYGPLCGVHYVAGGTDPIDGTDIYDSQKQIFHRHIISYGMSELYYNPKSVNEEFSKWGFEFTFRLKPFAEDEGDPIWAIQVMNNLARYVFDSGRWFEENQLIPANGPIRLNTNTAITGFVFALDPELGKIDTPHGEVSFVQMVGITDKELEQLMENPTTGNVAELIEEMKKDNPLLITDLERV